MGMRKIYTNAWALFNDFNRDIFGGRLNLSRLEITRSTDKAGDCDDSVMRISRVLVTDYCRLAHVVAHEMCHLAEYQLSSHRKVRRSEEKGGDHGPTFHRWGLRFTEAYGMMVRTYIEDTGAF